MVSQGNHEIANNQIHFKKRFSMPGKTNGLWYSFTLSKAYFIAFTSEPLFHDSIAEIYDMMDFLEEELEDIDRTMYPWIIAYSHRPFYCSTKSGASGC